MTAKSAPPFVVRKDRIIHSETGQRLPYLAILGTTAVPASLAVVVGFDDAVSRRRKEELSWSEFCGWSKFYNKMMSYGYRCDNVGLLKSLHGWYVRLNIPVQVTHLPTSGWWTLDKIAKSYYIRTNVIKNLSPTSRVLHKGSYAQPVQYGSDILASDIASYREISFACGWSPTLMVATLSPFAATLLPAARDIPSFCIFYGADAALDREVIRYAAACVFGARTIFRS
jgi:hypothetical protein